MARNHIDEQLFTFGGAITGGDPVSLVVVSNRVARAKANEPMTGGLAAALLPVVENSGAIWVGSSGNLREGAQKEPFAEIEPLGSGALAMLDLQPRITAVIMRVCQLGPVAGAAFAHRPDRHLARRLSFLPRGQRLHGAGAVALPQAGCLVLDSGLSFPDAGAELRKLGVQQAIGSSCTRRGRRARSSAACRTIRNWSRRCWPIISWVSDRGRPRQLHRLS